MESFKIYHGEPSRKESCLSPLLCVALYVNICGEHIVSFLFSFNEKKMSAKGKGKLPEKSQEMIFTLMKTMPYRQLRYFYISFIKPIFAL